MHTHKHRSVHSLLSVTYHLPLDLWTSALLKLCDLAGDATLSGAHQKQRGHESCMRACSRVCVRCKPKLCACLCLCIIKQVAVHRCANQSSWLQELCRSTTPAIPRFPSGSSYQSRSSTVFAVDPSRLPLPNILRLNFPFSDYGFTFAPLLRLFALAARPD